MPLTTVTHQVTVAAGRWGPGHLGELTQIISFDLVDAALAATGAVQQRVRDLPSRVVVYLLIAAALFPEVSFTGVWAKLVASLDQAEVATPTAGGLAKARARVGPAPMAALADLLMPAAAGPHSPGAAFHGRTVCAIDGTHLCAAETPANLSVYTKGGCHHGRTGYPLVRVLALLACGTRTLTAVTFGSTARGETSYVADLTGAMGPQMIVLADRNFAARAVITAIAGTGADLLVRAKTGRRLPVCATVGDGSWISRIGDISVRVIRASITVATTPTAGGSGGRRCETYQLITTVTDPAISATELVALYHQRWEIETAFLQLKSTLWHGQVLRARTPAGVAAQVWAVLIAYQGLRICLSEAAAGITDAGGTPVDADRCSFAVALRTARDQVVRAAGVVAEAAGDHLDVARGGGQIAAAVLAELLPDRRCRVVPRVVKRAISNYAPNTRKGRLRGPSYKATISIDVLHDPTLTPTATG